MMLSPAHIATVAHGLAYLLNQSEMCQLSAADELRDALGACRYPHDFLYDDRRIYPVLYRHNEAAYEGRYKAKPDETDEVPAMQKSASTRDLGNCDRLRQSGLFSSFASLFFRQSRYCFLT